MIIITKKEILLNCENTKRERELQILLNSVMKSIKKLQKALKEKD